MQQNFEVLEACIGTWPTKEEALIEFENWKQEHPDCTIL